MKLRITHILLICIIIIAAFFRFYQLGINPSSLSWDEVAFGYNAYTIGIDGKDEFGRFLPLNYLESFGDFKPPMYAYLDVIPVKLFGLTDMAVRIPSAFFGVLTVFITYFLIKRIFKKTKEDENSSKTIALLGSFCLAISPWHIMLSRAAFEANVATFFLVTGVWLFLGSVQDKKWYLPFAAGSFVAGIYTFNTARVVGPLLVLVLSALFIKKLWKEKKVVIVAAITGVVMLLPIIGFLRTPQAALRFQEVNIFSDVSLVQQSNQEIAHDHNVWWSKVIHNRRWIYTMAYLQHYFDNLSPDFLFIHGDGNPKFSIQDVGQMYLWDIPFFIIGIFCLFRYRPGVWWVIPVWLVLGIIPAATARETPHALRTEATLPAFQIFIAFGIYSTWEWVKKINMKKIIQYTFIGAIVLALFGNVMYFWHTLLTHYQYTYSGTWLYGQEQMAHYIHSVEGKYEKVYISDSFGRPYIYMAMYTKVNPQVFRTTAIVHRDAFGFVNILGFGKYVFVSSFPVGIGVPKNVLYVGPYNMVPQKAHIVHVERALNGDNVVAAFTL